MIKIIMKYTFIALFISATMAFSCSSPSVASDDTEATGIDFKKLSLDQALNLAEEQGKLVFIDAFTTWCGPCKKMARTTFKNEEVGAYFNEHFISIKVDMERGEGPKLEKKYDIRSYPTLLFLETSGKQKKKLVGFHQKGEFLRLAKKIAR
jgi:thiol:disulfide interchange protein